MKIKIEAVFPPVPSRRFDFAAYDEDTYDAELVDGEWQSSSPVGYGPTEADAIADLMEQMADRDEEAATKLAKGEG